MAQHLIPNSSTLILAEAQPYFTSLPTVTKILPIQVHSAVPFVTAGATLILKSFYFTLPLSILLAPGRP